MTLILSLCLVADPGHCRREELPFSGGLFECAMAGQFQGAAWVSSHPKWKLVRWSCGARPAREV